MIERAVGILGGDFYLAESVARWADSAQRVYAADGGAIAAQRSGLKGFTVVGDMDHATDESLRDASKVIQEASQTSTDCDKLLELAARHEVRSLALLAAEGDRLDHVLATLCSCARSDLDIRLALRTAVAWILRAGAETTKPAHLGGVVSLIPLTRCTGVTLEGVRWPLQDAELDPLGLVSISNAATEPVVRAHIEVGTAVLFIESREGDEPKW